MTIDRVAAIDGLVRRLTTSRSGLAGEPMVWGVSDCGAIANALCFVLTGEKALKPWPKYKTEEGAARVIRRRGHDTLRGLVDSIFQRVPEGGWPVAGDLIGLPVDGGGDDVGLAICLGYGAVLQIADGVWRRGHLEPGLKFIAWKVA